MTTWDFEALLEQASTEALRQVIRGLVYERSIPSIEVCKRCKAAIQVDEDNPPKDGSGSMFELDGYLDLKYLSSGGFGVVAHGRMAHHENEKVAIKRMPLQDWQNAVRLIREIFYMINLDHPNVCNIIDVQFYSEYLFLMTPLCEPGSLNTFAPSSSSEVKIILTGMYCGLEYLHHMRICHRDVKPDNIFVHRVEDGSGKRPKVLVADLGMARLNVSKSKTGANEMCTANYIAPELLKGIAYDYPADVWASAVTVWEFVVTVGKSMPTWVLFPSCTAGTRRHYQQSVALVEKSDKWAQNRWKALDKCVAKNEALFGSAEIPTILGRCLKIIPEERPTISEILRDFRDSLDVETSTLAMGSTCGPYPESEQGLCFESFQEDLAKMPSADYRMRKIRMQLREFQGIMKRRRSWCYSPSPSITSIYVPKRPRDGEEYTPTNKHPNTSTENCSYPNKRHAALSREGHGGGNPNGGWTLARALEREGLPPCTTGTHRGYEKQGKTTTATTSTSPEREMPRTPISVPPAPHMLEPMTSPHTPPRHITYRLPVTPPTIAPHHHHHHHRAAGTGSPQTHMVTYGTPHHHIHVSSMGAS